MSEPSLIDENNKGYYYETTDQNVLNNLYDTLTLAKNNNIPTIGDYLLLFINNGNNIINMYKYIIDKQENGFAKINIDEYIFIYTDLENNIKFKQVYNNNINDIININYSNFSGLGGNNIPDNSLGNIEDYYLKNYNGYIYYKIDDNNWIRIITCFSINIYDYNNDRYIIYINFNELDYIIKKIIYYEQEYQGYQGYYSNDEINTTTTQSSISTIIKNLKLGRDVIIGDSLLCKYNDDNNINYKIFVIINTDELNIKMIDLDDEFLFYDNNILMIYYINDNIKNIYSYYYDQSKKLFTMNLIHNDGNINIENNNIITFVNGYWVVTYLSLYKFNIIDIDNNKLISYTNYQNLKVYNINEYNTGKEYQKYQGYYNSTQTLEEKNDFAIIEILQYYKNDYVNIRDCLLIKINNIITSCQVLLNNDKLIDYNVVDNQTFFLNVDGDKVHSQFIEDGVITQFDNFEIDINDFELFSMDIFPYTSGFSGNMTGMLSLNTINKTLKLYYNDTDLYPVNINNRYIMLYSPNIKCKIYTKIDKTMEIVYNNTNMDIFNGYYSETNISFQNYYQTLEQIKINTLNYNYDVKLGDYLLLSNNDDDFENIQLIKI